MSLEPGKVYEGDCIELMKRVRPASIALVFADPPFNIGYNYDIYDDRRAHDDYLHWSRSWIRAVHRILRPNGTFWLAIGDEYAAELKLIAQKDAQFYCRSWVVWYYTFGVNCTKKFSRSHTHLFHFVKNPDNFTFNFDDPAVRVPSARQLVYADARANPKGRLPDDTWILRPQDVPIGFAADSDTWYFPRVAGTFKERAGFHGCQMPEQLLGRIILMSSCVGDQVFDPFAGSGTTLAVAKKLGRTAFGTELSAEYARKANQRLVSVRVGDQLNGARDPLRSAPATPNFGVENHQSGSRPHSNNARRVRRPTVSAVANGSPTTSATPKASSGMIFGRDEKQAIIEAYKLSNEGFSSDRVLADPSLNAAFVEACNRLGVSGTPKDWNLRLLRIRKCGELPPVARERMFRLTFKQMDPFSFASELALESVRGSHGEEPSLDDILCDPPLAAEFDGFAKKVAPGYSEFHYRWAALAIRKKRHEIIERAQQKHVQFDRLRPLRMMRSLVGRDLSQIAGVPGVYILRDRGDSNLYVGETFNLGTRLRMHAEWTSGAEKARYSPTPEWASTDRQALKSIWIGSYAPKYNWHELAFRPQSAA